MATYYVSAATGNDGDTGLTELLAWATIDHAMNTVSSGDTVYVKADGNYNETATIDTEGTSSASIVFEGYTSTPGDGGQATIDGQSTRTYCINDLLSSQNVYYVFKNFIFENTTSHCVSLSVWDIFFKNCTFRNAVGSGCNCVSAVNFENCLFDSNSSRGVDASGNIAICVGCRFVNNTNEGVEYGGGAYVFHCVFVGNGADAIEALGGSGSIVIILGCTIDGDGKTTNDGIDCNSSFWKRIILCNNIVYDCTTGIRSFNQAPYFISRNNLVNNNGNDYISFQTLEGEVTDAPQFEDEAGGDYSLGSESPALNAGFDGYLQNGSDQLADIGAIESTPADGGGLLVHPGTSGGARG